LMWDTRYIADPGYSVKMYFYNIRLELQIEQRYVVSQPNCFDVPTVVRR
jgi:hypothetical protein